MGNFTLDIKYSIYSIVFIGKYRRSFLLILIVNQHFFCLEGKKGLESPFHTTKTPATCIKAGIIPLNFQFAQPDQLDDSLGTPFYI
jgi:hypothetical protein